MYMCVVLKRAKMQQSRALHHPINYSHYTMSSTMVHDPHAHKDKLGCKEHGNTVKKNRQTGQCSNQLSPSLSKFLFQPKSQSTSITTE